MFRAKISVLVLPVSLLVTKTSKKNIILKKLLYMHYLLYFQKDIAEVKTLINLCIEFNTITLAYIAKLSLKVYHIDVED